MELKHLWHSLAVDEQNLRSFPDTFVLRWLTPRRLGPRQRGNVATFHIDLPLLMQWMHKSDVHVPLAACARGILGPKGLDLHAIVL